MARPVWREMSSSQSNSNLGIEFSNVDTWTSNERASRAWDSVHLEFYLSPSILRPRPTTRTTHVALTGNTMRIQTCAFNGYQNIKTDIRIACPRKRNGPRRTRQSLDSEMIRSSHHARGRDDATVRCARAGGGGGGRAGRRAGGREGGKMRISSNLRCVVELEFPRSLEMQAEMQAHTRRYK